MKWVISVIFLCVGLVAQVSALKGSEVTAGEPIGEEGSGDEYGENGQVKIETEVMVGRVEEIGEFTRHEYDLGQELVSGVLSVRILSGSIVGELVNVDYNRALAKGERIVKVGDKVLVNMSRGGTEQEVFYFVDYVRQDVLLWLFLLFAILVVAIGGGQGLSSLVGLASSFAVIFGLILPGIQSGFHPVLVSIAGAGLIILVTFYMSHGVNEKTTIAIGGTLVSLVLTGILGTVFVGWARLSGFGVEEAAFLQVVKDGELNMRGLLLAGIIIGALGVLDDITISQASIVKELREANASLTKRRLFLQAMNVGRDHIASLVNTLVLVYAGGALPLLLLFSLDESRSIMTVVNYEMLAEEVVRTLVGSIGLVMAVPITTLLAVQAGSGELRTNFFVRTGRRLGFFKRFSE